MYETEKFISQLYTTKRLTKRRNLGSFPLELSVIIAMNTIVHKM